MNQAEDLKEISYLKPNLKGINIKVRCNSVNEEREIISKSTGEKLRVTEALVGDETGCVLLTLWNDDIDKMESDHVYQLSNVYTTLYRGSLRLNIGRYGSLEEIDEENPEYIDVDNNLSDKIYEQRQQYHPRQDRGTGYDRRPYRDDRSGYSSGRSRGKRRY